jgi:hypothetical protein
MKKPILLIILLLNVIFVLYYFLENNNTWIVKNNNKVDIITENNKINDNKRNIFPKDCDLMFAMNLWSENFDFNDYSTKECIKKINQNNFSNRFLFEQDLYENLLKNKHTLNENSLKFYKNIFKNTFSFWNEQLSQKDEIDWVIIMYLLKIINEETFLKNIINDSLNWKNSNLLYFYINNYFTYFNENNLDYILKVIKEAKSKWYISDNDYNKLIKLYNIKLNNLWKN